MQIYHFKCTALNHFYDYDVLYSNHLTATLNPRTCVHRSSLQSPQEKSAIILPLASEEEFVETFSACEHYLHILEAGVAKESDIFFPPVNLLWDYERTHFQECFFGRPDLGSYLLI